MKIKTQVILIVITVAVGLLLVLSWFSLTYVPPWYKPEYISDVDQQSLTDEITDISRKFNNKMQRPEAFGFSIPAGQINRLIAGRGLIFPELEDIIPEYVHDPAVQLDDDEMKIGAVLERDGKKVFASMVLKVSVDGDVLRIDKLKVYVGLWPVPQKVLDENIKKVIKKTGKYFSEAENILTTRTIKNHFKFPNSDYDFRIKSLHAKKGILHITIEPLKDK